MTRRQKKFCEEYLIDADAKAAALRAGYSAHSHTTAGQLLAREEIRRYIDSLKKETENEGASATEEVVGFLRAVMRGDVEEFKTSAKDRLHAAELLGKRYGIFDDKDGGERATVIFSGEGDLV